MTERTKDRLFVSIHLSVLCKFFFLLFFCMILVKVLAQISFLVCREIDEQTAYVDEGVSQIIISSEAGMRVVHFRFWITRFHLRHFQHWTCTAVALFIFQLFHFTYMFTVECSYPSLVCECLVKILQSHQDLKLRTCFFCSWWWHKLRNPLLRHVW